MSHSVAVCCCVHLCLFWRGRERRCHAPFFSRLYLRRESESVAACPVPMRVREIVRVRCGRREAAACTFCRASESRKYNARWRVRAPESAAQRAAAALRGPSLSPPLSLTLSHNGTHGLCDHSLLFCGGPPPRDTHLSLRRLCCQTPGSTHDHATTSTHTDSFLFTPRPPRRRPPRPPRRRARRMSTSGPRAGRSRRSSRG